MRRSSLEDSNSGVCNYVYASWFKEICGDMYRHNANNGNLRMDTPAFVAELLDCIVHHPDQYSSLITSIIENGLPLQACPPHGSHRENRSTGSSRPVSDEFVHQHDEDKASAAVISQMPRKPRHLSIVLSQRMHVLR